MPCNPSRSLLLKKSLAWCSYISLASVRAQPWLQDLAGHLVDADLQSTHEHSYEPYAHLDELNHGDQFINQKLPLESQPGHDQSQFSDFDPCIWLDLDAVCNHPIPRKRNAMAH